MKKKVLSVLLAGCICCPTMMNIGDSTIRVKAIDHSQKTITLEAVKETADLTDYIKDFDSLEKAPTDVMFSGNQVLIRFHLMVQKNGCVIEPDKVKWEVSGTANSAFDGNSFTKIESYDETYAIAYCLLTVNSPGTVCVKGTEINSSSGAETPLYWNFNVIEDGNFDGTVTYDKPVVLSGDVNADGSFSIADVVMLQKWILGIPDVTLPNWEAADLCEDRVLNVFDLCMMKRELISQKQFDDTPVLLVDDYIITESENGWGSKQYYRVVTANGSRYSTEAFVADTEPGYEWTVKDDVNLIMREGEKEQYITDTEVLQKISEFTKKASEYKNCEMKNWNYGVSDYGKKTLYVLYNDDNGTMQQLELCRFGDDCAWLDNTEVQEFVTLLIEKGYFANSSILEDYLKNKE